MARRNPNNPPGKPKLPKGEALSKAVPLRVTPLTKKLIKQAAKDKKQTPSVWLRTVIADALDRNPWQRWAKDMLERSKLRSPNYHKMTEQERWDEDKRLGILDWDGRS